jgi:hypothetical protein
MNYLFEKIMSQEVSIVFSDALELFQLTYRLM